MKDALPDPAEVVAAGIDPTEVGVLALAMLGHSPDAIAAGLGIHLRRVKKIIRDHPPDDAA